jgi:hypothetical protein
LKPITSIFNPTHDRYGRWFCYIEKNGDWVQRNLTDKDHIRGALKAYRTTFQQIGGLKAQNGMGYRRRITVNYNWKVVTDSSLHVKHLKPTGANYNKTARYKQRGVSTLGYGLLITAIASAKLSFMKKTIFYF